MIKTVPLTIATLKGFLRNWRTIALLLLLPLVLISSVFLSFNPNGIQPVPIGLTNTGTELNVEELSSAFSYLRITQFNSVDECIKTIYSYTQYACIEVISADRIEMNIYFDNTREPIIYQVLQRIKGTIDLVQKERSTEIASDFLTAFNAALDKLDLYSSSVTQLDGELDGYIRDTRLASTGISQARGDLTNSIQMMDSDINEAKYTKNQLQSSKQTYYWYTTGTLSSLDSQLMSISPADGYTQAVVNNVRAGIFDLQNRVDDYSDDADSSFADFDQRIAGYETSSQKGKEFSHQMSEGVWELQGVESNLRGYRVRLSQLETDISQIQSEFSSIRGLSADSIVNPIVIYNNPTYVPKASEEAKKEFEESDDKVGLINRGLSLIGLQTLFPTLLVLLTLFLSLLISTFVTLTSINSPASTRIRMIKGTFAHEIIAMYLSSLILIAVPLTVVILLGAFLFQLPYSNGFLVSFIVFLLSSTFITIGMSLAYLIRKESITLLVATFTMMFFFFFSGLLLPKERMGDVPAFIAARLPGTLALEAFNMSVFYAQPMRIVETQVLLLAGWLCACLVLVVVMKKLKG